MNTEKPTIDIDEFAPGVFVITGHNPKNVQTDKGTLCVERATIITPELPSEVLFSILEKRGEGAFQKLGEAIDLANGTPGGDDVLSDVCKAIPAEYLYLPPAQAVAAICQDLETVRALNTKLLAEIEQLKLRSESVDVPAPLPVFTEGQPIQPRNKGGRPSNASKAAKAAEVTK